MKIDSVILISFLTGVLPAVVWLLFWLQEDRRRPEPKRLILRTFIFGMLAVFLVLPFQKTVDILSPGMTISALMLWAIGEELFKLGAAYFGGLRTPDDNEPIDPMIYMITAALGFVSLENALFIATPLVENDIVAGIVTGNMRFIGASLLHTATSGILGASLGLAFYKPLVKKLWYFLLGLVGVVGLHTVFNALILKDQINGTFFAFAGVWLVIILLILTFEKVKTIAR